MVYPFNKSFHKPFYRDTDVSGINLYCFGCHSGRSQWKRVGNCYNYHYNGDFKWFTSFLSRMESNKASEALKKMVNNKVSVFRKGSDSIIDINIVDLVPGDVIFLSAGDMIPADVRIVSVKDLFVTWCWTENALHR